MRLKRSIVAHVTRAYLPSTETFIYQYLTHIRNHHSLVLALVQEHPERFPFPNVYTPGLSRLGLLLVRADRRIFHRQRLVDPFFEKVIRSRGVGLLHAHFGYNGVFALPLHVSSGLPLVTTFYGADASVMPRKPGWRQSYRRLFKHGALFLTEGSHLKSQLIALGCPPERIWIQRIGVDMSRFSYRVAPPTTEGVRVLMCGRFTEKKGLEYGIRAFARVWSEFPNAQLRVVGDGPLRQALEGLVDSLGPEVSKRVSLLGRLDYDAYTEETARAHLFMAPSVTATNGDSEGGAPTVLLEMQARGIPVLSTWHADIPEVVVDDESGYLVPERDDVALSEKLSELLAHPERWNEMGRAGREHIEKHHNIVKLARQLEEKYDMVLGRSSGS